MTTPPPWAEGDTVTAAKLNSIIAAMDEVFGITRDYGYQTATPYIGTGGTATLFKFSRFLHFGSNGALKDPTGVEPDISLNENTETERGTLDLDTVEWLGTGAMFLVTGCNRIWMDNKK